MINQKLVKKTKLLNKRRSLPAVTNRFLDQILTISPAKVRTAVKTSKIYSRNLKSLEAERVEEPAA